MNSSMQRSTKQRTAIQQAMTQADRPLAPQEVLEPGPDRPAPAP